jgi:hypothetical protein
MPKNVPDCEARIAGAASLRASQSGMFRRGRKISCNPWERTVGTRVDRSDAGWRAPQPPTPHPSGDRPWPLRAPGSSFFLLRRHARACHRHLRLKSRVQSKTWMAGTSLAMTPGSWRNTEQPARLESAAQYPIRARVGAGLADPSTFG